MSQRRINNLIAFTLVEILIVCAIFMVMVAIIIPVYANARRSGHQAMCISNLRQISAAIAMYLDDNGDALPRDLFNDLSPLMPLIKSKALFLCPSDPYRLGANYNATRAMGHKVSYFPPYTIEPRIFERLLQLDSNYGVSVCLVHGQLSGPMMGSAMSEFKGLILRARKDTSVRRVQSFSRCWVDEKNHYYSGRTWWDLYTDVQPPKELTALLVLEPTAREIPCSEVRF